jgi:uncharacterized protein (TIGR02001 family)
VRSICSGIAWLFACPVAVADELHGYLTLGSDYVFRGISQANGDPTAQGGIDYAHRSGVVAGLFIALVDFPAHPEGEDLRQTELDIYLGYSRPVGDDWAWDAAVLHYGYPDSGAFDYSYEELAVNLHFRDVVRLGATVSENSIGGQTTGWTAEVELRQPLGSRARLSGSLGRYAFERSDWRDYFYWDLGVSTVAGPLTFDLRYFDTSGEATSVAGTRLTRARLVASLSIGF